MIKSILLLFSSTVFSSVLTLVTQTVIASELGPEEFGIFSSSLALVMLLSPLIAMGSDGYYLKFVTIPNSKLCKFNSNWVFYFFITSIPALSVYFYIGSTGTRLLALLMISQSLINFCVALFQSKKRYILVSLLLSLQSLARVVALLLFIFFSDVVALQNVVKLYFGVAMLMILCCFYILYKLSFKFVFIKGLYLIKDEFLIFVKSAAPFGFTTLLHLVYFQSDIIIINRFYSSEEAGLYSAAFMVLTAAYMIPSVIYQKYFLPIAHQLSSSGDKSREYQYFKKGTKYIFLLSLFSMTVYYFSSELLINFIYGDEYYQSSLYLKILSICIVFRFLSSNAGIYLMTENLIHKKNKYMLVCAIFNITLNLVFIPIYGAIAAAITTISTEILLCSLFYRGIKKFKFSKIYTGSLC
ncbi:oligosaccharide flippase family protein [Providencia huaxiensis]|uniref:oligosaccharide flippase family protein n=1 Tax=Providencia huaxiensis TaxID=2027290 RepID=UPI0034E4330B